MGRLGHDQGGRIDRSDRRLTEGKTLHHIIPSAASRATPYREYHGLMLVIVAGLGLVVGLSPVQGSTGLPAYARTDGQGVFRVTSTRGGQRDAGAAAGEYVVTVSKVVADEGDVAVVEDGSGKKPARRPSSNPPRNLVPDVYAEVNTSPLRATIKAGANTGPAFVYDLKSPAPKATPGKR